VSQPFASLGERWLQFTVQISLAAFRPFNRFDKLVYRL